MTAHVLGVDVASVNGVIPWKACQDRGVEFGIARCTYGLAFVDGQFKRNWSETKTLGILRGGYMVYVPTVDPEQQARAMWRAMGPLDAADLPPSVDVEIPYPKTMNASLRLAHLLMCVRELRRRTGRTPLIYMGKYFWLEAYGGLDSVDLAALPLWHPQYPSTRRDTRPYLQVMEAYGDPSVGFPWASRGISETIYQWDGDGGLFLPNGVDGDFDRFRGSRGDLEAFVRKSQVSEPMPLAPYDWTKVADLQMALNKLGAHLDEDGIPGPRTAKALRDFQTAHGRTADGLVGPNTIDALEEALGY